MLSEQRFVTFLATVQILTGAVLDATLPERNLQREFTRTEYKKGLPVSKFSFKYVFLKDNKKAPQSLLLKIAAKAGAKAGASLGMSEAKISGAEAGALAGAVAGQRAAAEAAEAAATKAATEVATKTLKEALETLGKLQKPVQCLYFLLNQCSIHFFQF